MRIHEPSKPPTQKPRPVLDGAMVRLITLFGLFIAVIYAMLVAQKPETWAKLGFGEVTPENGAQNDSEARIESGSGGESAKGKKSSIYRPPADRESPLVQEGDPVIRANTNQPIQDLPNDSVAPFKIQLSALDAKIESVEQDFWRQVYDRMNPPQRRVLYSFIRFAEGKVTADTAAIETYRKLVKALQDLRDEYQGKLLEHITSLPSAELEQKKVWNEILFEIQQSWNQKVSPALTCRLDDRESDETTVAVIDKIRSQVKRQAMRFVRDGTSISRPKDAIAWLMTLEEIQEKRTVADFTDVTQVELSSQPMTFRGSWVHFKGRARSGKIWQLNGHELGIENLYVLFVQPDESSTIPYCVITQKLPEGFPAVERQFVKLDEGIEVTGQFFKIRSYEANGGWRECPMVLCFEPTWIPTETQPVNSEFVMPSWPLMIAAIVLIAILAIGIAIWVYRTTQVDRSESESDQQKISSELGDLKNAPIETVTDRLRKISNES